MVSSAVLVGATGWLGRSIGPAILEEEIISAGELICVNRSGPSDDYDRWPGVGWINEFDKAATTADVVILAVRPDQFRSASFLCENALVLSLMAGVTLQELNKHTGATRIIRAMPNAAVESRHSYTPWIASGSVTQADRDFVASVLCAVGSDQEVPGENELNILTGLSGAGPAYTALLIRALTSAAKELGLDADLAEEAAMTTVLNSSGLIKNSGQSSEDIIEKFLEYDGIIAAGLNAAIQAGFDSSLKNALKASKDKVQILEATFSSDPISGYPA